MNVELNFIEKTVFNGGPLELVANVCVGESASQMKFTAVAQLGARTFDGNMVCDAQLTKGAKFKVVSFSGTDIADGVVL